MNVCHITSVHQRYDPRIFYKECCALVEQGFNVTLIVADGLREETKSGVRIYDIGKFNGRFKRMLTAPKVMLKKVLELKPDLIHFHDPELMNIGRKLAKDGYNVIYDVHEDVPGKILVKHWIPKLLRPLVSRITQKYEESSAQLFAGMICAAEVLTKRFIQHNKNSITLDNFPSIANLNNSYTEWERRENSICYVGSITEVRGIIPLIDSLAISKLPLDLIGKYSPPKLEEELKLRPGYKYVNYMGVVTGQKLADYLKTPKIGIATLLPIPAHVEAQNFSTKIFEYLLAGIPIVISDFPLWVKFVKKYNCGIAVDPNKPEQIAEACNYLLQNQDIARQMGNNGRKAVLENFTWETEQLKLVTLYKQILSRKS